MAKASKLKSGPGGKLASAKSKTGNPQCSKAMSDWVRGRKGGTVPPETFSILAKCRAQAKQNRGAAQKQAAGKLAAGRGTWQRSEAAQALMAKRAATRVTPRNMPTVTPRNTDDGFSLKRDSAVGKKAFAIENLGKGRTGSMFDMKKGDLPGQTSIFDKIKTVDTRAGTPAAPAKPANTALQKAKARIARNRRAGATDGASGARIAEARRAKVGAAKELRDAKRATRGAAGRLEEVKGRVAGKKDELAGLKAQSNDTLRGQIAATKEKIAATNRATAKQDRANTRAERKEGRDTLVNSRMAVKSGNLAPKESARVADNVARLTGVRIASKPAPKPAAAIDPDGRKYGRAIASREAEDKQKLRRARFNATITAGKGKGTADRETLQAERKRLGLSAESIRAKRKTLEDFKAQAAERGYDGPGVVKQARKDATAALKEDHGYGKRYQFNNRDSGYFPGPTDRKAPAKAPSRSNPERAKVAAELKAAHRTKDRDTRYDKVSALDKARESIKARSNAAAPVAPAHKARLDKAFAELDSASKGKNFVMIHDLRRKFPDLSRPQFDAMLREARLAGKYSGNEHEGMHGKLTRRQRKAGIKDAGANLVYLSRR